jgi:hypothetical protein
MNSGRFVRGVFVFVFLLATFAIGLPAWGQTGNQGTIEGTFVDQKGGLVPDVALELRNTATSITFKNATDSTGFFRFSVVPVGLYELTASKTGFAPFTQKEIEVTVGAKISLNLTLQIAGQATSVTVSGEVPVVETARTQVSATVNDRAVADLPVLGRNFINFVLLTPGVNLDRRTGDISFAGQRGTLNSLVIDGTDNNNTFFGQTTGRTGSGRAPYQFSQDAVAEFQVNSNSYGAELGHAGGAVINVVTKSGTNQLHGTGFEFYRDSSLNANDLINKINHRGKSFLHFNQFGGNIGGPVVKDKLFFFFDYDGQRNTLPNIVFLNLPTGFAISANPAIAAFQNTALTYLNARAASWNQTQNQNVYLGKIDWQISSGNLLSGRINSQRFTGGNFENSGTQNALEHTGASVVHTDTISVSLTSSLSHNRVNVARFNYLRDDEPGQANSVNPEAIVQEGGQTVLTVGRNSFSPRFTNIKRGEWSDTLSVVHNHHEFKFGADIIMDRIANFFPGNFFGSYTFSSLENFGRSLSSQPLVTFTSTDKYLQAFAGSGTSGPTTNPNLFEWAIFAQDEYRVRPGLTLTYGMRYELQNIAQPTKRNPAAFAAGIDTSFIPIDRNNFAPRVGVAWAPFNDEKMVFRGGYGIYYGRTPSILIGTADSNNGLNVSTITYLPSGGQFPSYPNTQCGAPTNNPTCAPPIGGTTPLPTILFFDKNYVQPLIQQWSFGVEREIAKDFSLTVSYLGVLGKNIQRTRDINLGTLTTGSIQVGTSPSAMMSFPVYPAARPIAAFSRMLEFDSTARSRYDGLTFQVNKRFTHNFQFLVSYTIGSVVDDNPDATAVVPGTDDAKMVQYPTLPLNDRATGQNDIRNRLAASGVWSFDAYAKGLSPTARWFLGGWELSAILTAQQGQPYSSLVSFDLNNDGNNRTDRFPGTLRDNNRLPRQVSLDPRITKTLNFTERLRLQLILEAFNVLNHSNIISVNTTAFSRSTVAASCGGSASCLLPSSLFGSPTATAGPRIVQLAAKISF